MLLFRCQDAALQFHAQILIIILFYFQNSLKNIQQKKYIYASSSGAVSASKVGCNRPPTNSVSCLCGTLRHTVPSPSLDVSFPLVSLSSSVTPSFNLPFK